MGSIMDMVTGKKSHTVTADSLVSLTEAGKAKANDAAPAQGYDLRILVNLNEQGPTTVRELAELAHLETQQTTAIITRLAYNNYVRVMNG